MKLTKTNSSLHPVPCTLGHSSSNLIHRKILAKLYKFLLLAILVTVLLPSLATAATYYVDATDGNDNNNGFSSETAWKTIDKVNASNFEPGDQILFKRGQIWRETLKLSSSGMPGYPIKIGDYGTGEKPIFDGANLISQWSYEGSNIWKAIVPIQPKIVIVNGFVGTRETSLGNLDFFNEWYWQDGVLYVFQNKLNDVEAANRDFCIENTLKDYVIFENLTLQNANLAGFQNDRSKHVAVNNLTVRRIGNGAGRGIFFGSDSFFDNRGDYGSISNCTLTEIFGDGIFLHRVKYFTIDRNTIYTVYAGIDGNGGDNIQLLDCAKITISNNWMTQESTTSVKGNIVAEGFSNIDANFVIEKNTCLYGNFGIGLYQANTVIIRYNTFGFHGGADWASTINATTSNYKNIKIHHNLLYRGTCGINFGTNHTKHNIKILNNTIYGFSKRGIATDEFAGQIKNNIIWGSSSDYSDFHYKLKIKKGGSAISDHNLIGPEGLEFILFGSKSFSSLLAFTIASGQDQNSLERDPEFIDQLQNNFKLKANSPCIKTGVNVGLSQDIKGDLLLPRKSVDIGCFKYITLNPPKNICIVPSS
jgi:hypothetical protein